MSELTDFMISHGGLILFLVGFAEQIGLPSPGAPFLLAAGALAAGGKFDLIAAICWTSAGCVVADAIWFLLGHRGKARVFRMFPHLRAVQVKLERATLARTVLHGARMLTVAKFIPMGQVVPMHAGALEVGRWLFLLVDAFTSIVYAAVFTALGFAFHNQLVQGVAVLQRLGDASLLLTLVLAATYGVYHFLKRRRTTVPNTSPASTKTDGSLCLPCS
jgi:membrane protein DedA with SNARE-associated domain